ncbi:phosphatidylinositol-specific phospholipase C/glycerophosphodiester phosphodiesterase family protein [soil metagenome]
MNILSHRGYWKHASEKNTLAAFARSFDLGFGTETDVRDRGADLVISHDPPCGGELLIEEVLDLLGDRDLPLAINVKADGLAARIHQAFAGRPQSQWFVFDMSIPDTLQHLKQGNPTFTRQSEYEPQPALAEQAAGVWLDSFVNEWWTVDDVHAWSARDKSVCIVSPELHRRDPATTWQRLANSPLSKSKNVSLCTDFPEAVRDLLENQS